MSSPRNIGGTVREGNRVVFREITASLHNSSPIQSSRHKSGNDGSATKSAEHHEVKVQFAREFADVGSITHPAPDSLSSAGSYRSLSSTLSVKSSSGICPDSVPNSPSQPSNDSYVNSNISGLEDLINGCAGIQLGSDIDCSQDTLQNSQNVTQDLSQDQTFASATDEPANSLNVTGVVQNGLTACEPTCSPSNLTQDVQEQPVVDTVCIKEPLPVVVLTTPNRRNSFITLEGLKGKSHSTQKNNERNDLNSSSDQQTGNSFVNGVEEASPLQCRSTEGSNLNCTVCLSPGTEILNVSKKDGHAADALENDSSTEVHFLSGTFVLQSESSFTDHVEEPSLPGLPTFSSLLNSTDSVGSSRSDAQEIKDNVKIQLGISLSPTNNSNVAAISSPQTAVKSPVEEVQDKTADLVESTSPSLPNDIVKGEQIHLNGTPVGRPELSEVQEDTATDICQEAENSENVVKIEFSPLKGDNLEVNATPPRKEDVKINKSNESVDESSTDVLEKTDKVSSTKEEENESESSNEKLDTTITLEDDFLKTETIPEIEQYTEFKPQRQSTSLATLNIEQPNFEDLKFAAEQVPDGIFQSLEFSEETDRFTSATSDIFQDPTSFDFLINHGNTKTFNRLRTESLYVKFDPLVGDNMLPQTNTQPISEEQNGKSESIPADINTSKSNPAIAAIDRLLFYSPFSTSMTQETDKPQEKMTSKEQPTEEPKSDTSLITDINMSKELELVRVTVLQLEEELEKQKKEYEAELKKQKSSYQDKINKLQAQIAQEIESKSEMTVVVDEYEKSISRLLTERERDRTNFEQEKVKLKEELQAANVHLSNTEAAFNDVHQKYEKLKGVVSIYTNNETVLKESIQENTETIKSLEKRYEELKNHATSRLENANFELDAMRKQHEDEIVKLHAIVRKAELKSNSLAELVEQKTKENKELTQILDEVIARVGHQNAE